jgi:hypothetical protein
MSETRALVPISQQWADQAQQAVQEEPVLSGVKVSMQSGQLSIDDEPLPGNQMYVVILDHYRENNYFTDKYVAGQEPKPPKCYAFGRGADADEMAPHESMKASLVWDGGYFEPQNDKCMTCPRNEWGTADTGKGKACQNRRRLIMLPAGYATPKKGSRDFDVELFTEPTHYATAEEAQVKLPVTSSKEFAKYVSQLGSQYQRPPHGVITRLWLEPHAAHQFTVKFEMIEEISDDLAQVIMDRNQQCRDREFRGYMPPEDNSGQQQAGSLKGVGRR